MKYPIFSVITITIFTVYITAAYEEKKQSPFKTIHHKKKHVEVISKEIPVTTPCNLFIVNHHGNITINSNHDTPTITVSAEKCCNKRKNLKALSPHISKKKIGTFDAVTIQTPQPQNQKKLLGSVHYNINVPPRTKLFLKTDRGNIMIDKSNSTLNAQTNVGDIIVHESDGQTHLQSYQYGKIIIDTARGPITATTRCGNITISDSTHTVNAHVQHRGNIQAYCSHLPKSHDITASTVIGSIVLTLPKGCNATLTGETQRGVITTEQIITLLPITTKLNRAAWNKFRQEVTGIIGTVGTSSKDTPQLSMRCLKGNIILKTPH